MSVKSGCIAGALTSVGEALSEVNGWGLSRRETDVRRVARTILQAIFCKLSCQAFPIANFRELYTTTLCVFTRARFDPEPLTFIKLPGASIAVENPEVDLYELCRSKHPFDALAHGMTTSLSPRNRAKRKSHKARRRGRRLCPRRASGHTQRSRRRWRRQTNIVRPAVSNSFRRPGSRSWAESRAKNSSGMRLR